MGWPFLGRSYATPAAATQAEVAYNRRLMQERAEQERAAAEVAKVQRMALADKIVMAIVDQICAAIIRPGPKPEERECYVMAQELRDFGPELRDIVADVLKVEEGEVNTLIEGGGE